MLTHLQIRDFVIVDRLELEFSAGMTVVTGETGAGKSILIDALGLALGERADTAMIRPGCEQAEVSASFDVAAIPEARAWLEAESLLEEEECLVRRIVFAQGRSKAWINGRPVTLQQLKALGDRLVEIHGQHEHQSLLNRTAQRALLDRYGGYDDLCASVGRAAARWKELQSRYAQLEQTQRERSERRELLAYQIEELDALALSADELPRLEAEHARLANAEQLLAACEEARQALYEAEDQNVASALGRTGASLAPFTEIDSHIATAAELIEGAAIQIQEAVHALREAVDRLEMDPERLHWLDQRLGRIQDLARKHRVSPEELPALHEQLLAEWQSVEDETQQLESVAVELQNAETEYRRLAAALSDARRKAAEALAREVTACMQGLAMEGGRFDVSLETTSDETPLPAGWDQVEFLVGANPGQPLRPLAKVASGGELSRISLAIQVVTLHGARTPTLIFDEVDVGIGGRVAETVGSLLRRLGEKCQVFCVTHLPQVAALGHHHLAVSKVSDQEKTTTRIAPLDESDRVDELARMLGGTEITAQTEAHAREMMQRAQSA
ncbi:MAG: DNA repair protein RecN [Gammaproteobacteria bacterium]